MFIVLVYYSQISINVATPIQPSGVDPVATKTTPLKLIASEHFNFHHSDFPSDLIPFFSCL